MFVHIKLVTYWQGAWFMTSSVRASLAAAVAAAQLIANHPLEVGDSEHVRQPRAVPGMRIDQSSALSMSTWLWCVMSLRMCKTGL